MGLNAQTSVPVFTAGQVLTAAQVTQINTGIPVFATTTTRDAAFGGTGEKTLAQGQYAYIEATSTLQVYNGSSWVSAVTSGLNFITSQTIGSGVASVTVTNAFSSTYTNYKIVITGGVGSTGMYLALKLGATATGYYAGRTGSTYANAASTDGLSSGVSFTKAGDGSANGLHMNLDIFAPFLAQYTFVGGTYTDLSTAGGAGVYSGMLNNTTSYTDFTVTPSTGTLTGGTIRIYGYANS